MFFAPVGDPNIVLRQRPEKEAKQDERTKPSISSVAALLAVLVVVLLSSSTTHSLAWLKSGAAIETLLITYSSFTNTRLGQSLPLLPTIASLNLLYAVASTSWLLYSLFAALCYPLAGLTVILVFPWASRTLTRWLGRLLKQSRIAGDKIVITNLPGLEFDPGVVSGLIVVRGLTLSLSDLRIEAYGIEAVIKIAKDIELAIYTDDVVIDPFRGIHVEEIFAVSRIGQDTEIAKQSSESTAGNESQPKSSQWSGRVADNDNVMNSSKKTHDGEDKTRLQTHTRSGNESDDIRHDVLGDSPLQRSRDEVLGSDGSRDGFERNTKEARVAVCTKLQQVPSVPNAPERSMSVAELLDLLPRWLRRFLKRAPLLQRFAMMLLGILHPVTVNVVSIGASGQRVADFQHRLIEKHLKCDEEVQHLESLVEEWLQDTSVCFEFTNLHVINQVPLQIGRDMVIHARCDHITAYRTFDGTSAVETALQIGGADTTFALPLWMLPDHEHLLPPPPREHRSSSAQGRSDEPESDEGEVAFSVHGRFPINADQSFLEFLSKVGTEAARVIEMEKDYDADSAGTNTEEDHGPRKRDKFFHRAKGMRHMRQEMKEQVKKISMGGIDDQWVAIMIGKLADRLQKAQGDLGYIGLLPVDLSSYRASSSRSSKLLP